MFYNDNIKVSSLMKKWISNNYYFRGVKALQKNIEKFSLKFIVTKDTTFDDTIKIII